MNTTISKTNPYTTSNFYADFDEAFTIVYGCNFHIIEDYHYNLEFMNRGNALGDCCYQGSNTYKIRLNQTFANVSDHSAIINTLVHELLHSLPNCMCHTGEWKKNASIVYHKTGIQIQRVATSEKSAEFNKAKAIKAVTNNPNKMLYYPVCSHCGYKYKAYQKKSQTVTNIMNHPNLYTCNKCRTKGTINIKIVPYADFVKNKYQLDI